MITKIISFFLSVLTVLFSALGFFTKVKINDDKSDFVPILRFIAGSDAHITTTFDKGCLNIQRAINAGYEIADADSNYNRLDAVMFAGDVTNDGTKAQFCSFYAAVKSTIRDDTQLMAVVANNHDCRTMGKNALQFYSELTGLNTDYHYVINGFHFIGISTSVNDEQYSEYQREWLIKQLDAAVSADASKPIFVTHHEHITNTVYGSTDVDGWGLDYFADILKKYPQVVDFSGHSHYPINDPRSVWQGEFTAVGTGEMSYVELTVDGQRKIHPSNYRKPATVWIVEVDANNRVRLRALDLNKGTWLCEKIINNPSNPDTFEFTPEKMAAKSSKPEFENCVQIKTSKMFRNVNIKFKAAKSTDNMPVFIYRAYVYNNDGVLVQTKWALSGYYLTPQPKEITMALDKLDKGNYTVKVIAENSYSIQSEPITTTIKV